MIPPLLQVRASIQAAQASEAARVQADIQRFCSAVEQYVTAIYAKRSFFAWATGVEAAFADIDKVAAAALATATVCLQKLLLTIIQRGKAPSAGAAPCTWHTRNRSSEPSALLLLLLPCAWSACPALQTSKDLEAMHTEHARLETLGKLFDCSHLLAGATASVGATSAELAALRAVWQRAAATEKKLAEWNQTVGGEGRRVAWVWVRGAAGVGSGLGCAVPSACWQACVACQQPHAFPNSLFPMLATPAAAPFLPHSCPIPARNSPPCSCLRLSTCLSWRRVPRG